MNGRPVTLAEVLLAGIFACCLYALVKGWG